MSAIHPLFKTTCIRNQRDDEVRIHAKLDWRVACKEWGRQGEMGRSEVGFTKIQGYSDGFHVKRP